MKPLDDLISLHLAGENLVISSIPLTILFS